MKLSVAMATYRGAPFLSKQIQSILDQDSPADEIVVSDDASSDQTFAIAKSFANTSSRVVASLQNINVGTISNFEAAIRKATGDVIVLSDQDDVWHRGKLSRIREAFESDRELGLAFSDARLIDRIGADLGTTLWSAVRMSAWERDQLRSSHAFDLLLRRFLVTGATMAFRRTHLDALLPFSKDLLHDAWISLVLSSISRIGVIDEPLMDYRQHDGQQVGERDKMRSLATQFQAARKMDADYFAKQLRAFTDVRDRVMSMQSQWVHPGIGELIEQKVRHCAARVAIRDNRPTSLPRLATEAVSGRYGQFSYGWKSIAQDLFL